MYSTFFCSTVQTTAKQREREERSSPQPPERDFGAREKRIVKSAALAKRERDTGRQICRWAGCTRCGGG